ncbi:exosome complex component RRP43-like [Oppia nitens]|uniref:exosome complex component RRP43-like n=1 Tax=Oppia nitens TaxID=1686743 RepID=UPI0023DC6743|nr:exosome complex component RRP43-like [Oppia nitens]
MIMSEEVKLLQPLQYINEFLKNGVRTDGRKVDDFRPMLLNCDTVGTANGSAMVKFGSSTVICGITTELIEANPETPEEGLIEITVELPALCSAKYCMTDSTNDALVLTQSLNNAIKQSKIIDLKKLCAVESKFVWKLNVSVICLNNDGNLLDLSLIAIVSAFHSCSLKSIVINEDNTITYEKQSKPLEVKTYPIATTIAIINCMCLPDPSADEECLADTVINIVVNADTGVIHSWYMTGTAKLDNNFFGKCYKIAKNRSKL